MTNDYACTFDGHDLAELFSIEYHMTRRLPTWEPTLVDVPARNGALFGGTRAQAVEIGMQLCPRALGRDERQEDLRTLASWLAVSEPKPLYLGDEGGRYRMAVPTGESEITPYLDADVVQIGFVCPDPRLYGDERSATVTTTATSILVDGTAVTRPLITATATPNGSGIWAITDLTTGEYMQVSLTSGSHTVVFDCEARTVKVDGAVTMLAPACDWLTFGNIEHQLQITTGTGTATVTWQEMWW